MSACHCPFCGEVGCGCPTEFCKTCGHSALTCACGHFYDGDDSEGEPESEPATLPP